MTMAITRGLRGALCSCMVRMNGIVSGGWGLVLASCGFARSYGGVLSHAPITCYLRRFSECISIGSGLCRTRRQMRRDDGPKLGSIVCYLLVLVIGGRMSRRSFSRTFRRGSISSSTSMCTRMAEYHDVKLVPVKDADGEVVLYDIFIDGKWIGSRRTIPQAIEAQRVAKAGSLIGQNRSDVLCCAHDDT